MINYNSESVTPHNFAAGDVIVQEGAETPGQMLIILKGSAGIYKNHRSPAETHIKNIGPGGFHGGRTVFLDRKHTETVIALSDITAFIVTRANVKNFFKAYPDTAVSMFENILGKLEQSLVSIHKLQKGESLEEEASGTSSLFPAGHKSYTLPMVNHNEKLVYCVKAECPMCAHAFDSLGVLQSRLRQFGTDPDGRKRYKDIEPLHYEIITCPACLFSADYRSFADTPAKFAEDIKKKICAYKTDTVIKTGRERDTFAVFAGFFLALRCAEVTHADELQLTAGGLWYKLCRLYADCKDKNMEKLAAEKALENYKYAYLNLRISEKQLEQVTYVLGELTFKLGDADAAKNYFYALKTKATAQPMMKRKAEFRLDDLRELTRK